jgi:hypothetical protein
VALALAALLFAGCGTLWNQKYRTVRVESAPAGALVRMNGARVGQAPLEVSVSAQDGAAFSVEWSDGTRAGCAITASVEPHWIALSLIFGGLVGPVIDASTGRWRDLDQTRCVVHHPVP